MEQQLDPVEIEEINDKIRSGEYFREARHIYSFSVHDPMAERYLYVFISAVTILVVLIALSAAGSLYPLRRETPFIVDSYNIETELPIVKPLKMFKDEDPNVAILRFLLTNYVKLREEYDISLIERSASGLRSQSTQEVFDDYQRYMDPRNGQSPIAIYQRESKRQIVVVSQRMSGPGKADVVFDAYVDYKGDRKQTRWVASVAFNYDDVKVDDNAVITPFKFTVTQYSSRPLQQ